MTGPVLYSVIVPVHNEQESLSHLHQALTDVMQRAGGAYEIIYADDASTDLSGKILAGFLSDHRVGVITFGKKAGQSCALLAGFRRAVGEWIITIDADLQNPPEEILRLLAYTDRADFMIGVREERNDPPAKRIASRVARGVRQAVLRDTIADAGCGLKVFRRRMIDEIPFFVNAHRFLGSLFQRMGYRVIQVPIQHQPRTTGRSKYGTWDRCWQGIADLAGVWWLMRRLCRYEDTGPSH